MMTTSIKKETLSAGFSRCSGPEKDHEENGYASEQSAIRTVQKGIVRRDVVESPSVFRPQSTQS